MSLHRIRPALLLLAVALAVPAIPTTAGAASRDDPGLVTTIPLPDGFQPEGIAIGSQPSAYFGSLADGSIYKASLLDGQGQRIARRPGPPRWG